MKLTWKQFRELTSGIPDGEEVFFELDCRELQVNVNETKRNFTNDNTVILEYNLEKIKAPKENWAGSLFEM